MNRVFIILTIFILTIGHSFASHISPDDGTIIKIDMNDDKVLIEFIRDSDVLTKRPILIYDQEGNQIFSAKAKKFEKITEINMTNVKDGKYIITMVLEDTSIDIDFIKE